MKNYYALSEGTIPHIKNIGGKARSLMMLINGGFPVPNGYVLSVDFFQPWTSTLMNQEHFEDWSKNPEDFQSLSDCLIKEAECLEFSADQLSILSTIKKAYPSNQLFAVRSSSPDEDLLGASFAGGYETVLGTTNGNLQAAIKRAFVSNLDTRVFSYKHEKGLDTHKLQIAVVIQEQIDAHTSGVAFSLNPRNNCYDEVVINANIGLGESVVSGMVTPDEVIIDKHQQKILKYKTGFKSSSIYLKRDGGTEVCKGIGKIPVVTDEHIKALTRLTVDVEQFFDFPVEIEWVFVEDELYLLQSRPITTYVPLPPELMTEPGAQKILHMDMSLTSQGLTEPISYLGCDVLKKLNVTLYTYILGKDVISDYRNGFSTVMGGRIYMNISNAWKVLRKNTATSIRQTDVALADRMKAMDMSAYIPRRTPAPLKGLIRSSARSNLRSLKPTLKAMREPDKYLSDYLSTELAMDDFLTSMVESYLSRPAGMFPLQDLIEAIFDRYVSMLDVSMPMFYAAEFSRFRIRSLLKKTISKDLKMTYLDRSLPGNVTIDMGLKMHELASFDEMKHTTFESFNQALVDGEVSETFHRLWDRYLEDYGFRTAMEMDVAVRRPCEDPKKRYEQIKSMVSGDDVSNPEVIYTESMKQRKETYIEIKEQLGSQHRIKKLEKHYQTLVTLGGYRETPKYWMVKCLFSIRKVLLANAEKLVTNGQLKEINDIFYLSLKEVELAPEMNQDELYALILPRQDYYRQLYNVKEFPKLIDSRGKILETMHRKTEIGEYTGETISPGLVTGRVKVLHTPDEKPLLPGEILVTRATDPGWTPLFINAAAILLEIGGILQHGALVAREYGKPCIVGLEGITDRLEDGQLVEVDAFNGIVRLIEKSI